MIMPSTSIIVAVPSMEIWSSSEGESKGERTGRGISILLAVAKGRMILRKWAGRMMDAVEGMSGPERVISRDEKWREGLLYVFR